MKRPIIPSKWGLISMSVKTVQDSNINEIHFFEGRSVFLNNRSPDVLDYLLALKQADLINSVSYHFGNFIYQQLPKCQLRELTEAEINLLLCLSTKLMEQLQQQDTCLVLSEINTPNWFLSQNETLYKLGLKLTYPEKSEWSEVLLVSGLTTKVETLLRPSEHNKSNPFVYGDGQLYLSRYFNYEKSVFEAIRASLLNRSNNWFEKLSEPQIERQVAKFFPPATRNEVDWQKQAVINAIDKKFSIICGGPGTGKTTTVVKLLMSLIALHQSSQKDKTLDIRLCAPTGKAAQRLGESISGSIQKLSIAKEVLTHIPTTAMTIHRLLKPRGQGRFFHDQQNPLAIDVLVLDEASMVDLSLMAKVIQALPVNCQLILLGDKEQLASVEAGNVLAEISAANIDSKTSFITELKKSYRFDDQSGIGNLAKLVKSGSAEQVVNLLNNAGNWGDINWYLDDQEQFSRMLEKVSEHYIQLLKLVSSGKDETTLLPEVFRHLNRLQLLTCVRKGDLGVEGVNDLVKLRLVKRGYATYGEQHYHGRPIMITENAYHLKLFNGDIGIELIDPTSGQLMSYFLAADGTLNKMFCQRLPSHDTVYAMTVHKSQGSEFEHAILVLAGSDAQVSRELFYTGLTRAKSTFSLFANESVIRTAVNNKTKRKSGLANLLENHV